MARPFHSLPTVPLNAGSDYLHSGELPQLVHSDDLALDVMIDFKETRAITISPDNSIYEARVEMKCCNTHLLLVTSETGKVVGLISSEDILGEKPVKIIQDKKINRQDIKVKMVMTTQAHVIALPMSTLKIAKIGDIIETLKQADQQYALVIENNGDEHIVRGMFSLTLISRLLATDIDSSG